jgi:hypothetical protein
MEIWKDITEYEGLYQVSNSGKVKSLERRVLNKHNKWQTYPERLLKFDINIDSNTSYCRVTLCKLHKTKRYLVHRLVAKMFIPNPLSKEHVNHIDNDGTNNQVSNIEWCTHSENMLHAQKQGRLFKTQSMAGIRSGELAYERVKNNAEKAYLVKFNHWKVISNELTKRASKYYVLCECECGITQQIEFSRLLRKEVSSCRRCAKNPEVQDIV